MKISPVDLVLKVSAGGIGGSEVPANSNRGPFVEPRLRLVGCSPGDPWCAADVAFSGHTALGTAWPLPLTGGCQALYEWAVKHNGIATTPSRGDVFLVWHPELKRFGHTGFVVTAGRPCTTHEGNTSGGGSREGWLKAERQRVFKPEDRFIPWYRLIPEEP